MLEEIDAALPSLSSIHHVDLYPVGLHDVKPDGRPHGAGRCRPDYDQGIHVSEDSFLFEGAGLICAQT
jgi:hypothetical protein